MQQLSEASFLIGSLCVAALLFLALGLLFGFVFATRSYESCCTHQIVSIVLSGVMRSAALANSQVIHVRCFCAMFCLQVRQNPRFRR